MFHRRGFELTDTASKKVAANACIALSKITKTDVPRLQGVVASGLGKAPKIIGGIHIGDGYRWISKKVKNLEGIGHLPIGKAIFR